MGKVLGALTIGQSPRTDLIPEVQTILGPGVDVIEAGALDGMTLDEVREIAPGPGDQVLVTRMADGTPVKIAEGRILPRMQRQIEKLVERGADIIALMCTGEFPDFRCKKLIVRPQKVLYHLVAAVSAGLSLGVLVPDEDQVDHAERRWRGAAARVKAEAASPYGSPDVVRSSSAKLKEWGADLMVMDCIGYTLQMKESVRKETGLSVMLARSVVARVLMELL